MFLDRLFNQTNSPVLEQLLQFTSARAALLGNDIANISTPGYRQKDLSLEKFQKMLGDRVDVARESAPGSVGFDDLRSEVEEPHRGILFHDRTNKSMELLVSDQAKNAMMHNLAIELLRKQFQTMEMALKDRIG